MAVTGIPTRTRRANDILWAFALGRGLWRIILLVSTSLSMIYDGFAFGRADVVNSFARAGAVTGGCELAGSFAQCLNKDNYEDQEFAYGALVAHNG